MGKYTHSVSALTCAVRSTYGPWVRHSISSTFVHIWYRMFIFMYMHIVKMSVSLCSNALWFTGDKSVEWPWSCWWWPKLSISKWMTFQFTANCWVNIKGVVKEGVISDITHILGVNNFPPKINFLFLTYSYKRTKHLIWVDCMKLYIK